MTEHPLRERLWALLMRALEEAGRRAEALETYAQARQVISDELGVDPGSELQRLYAELLAADASPRQPGAAPARRRASPTELARWRRKRGRTPSRIGRSAAAASGRAAVVAQAMHRLSVRQLRDTRPSRQAVSRSGLWPSLPGRARLRLRRLRGSG